MVRLTVWLATLATLTSGCASKSGSEVEPAARVAAPRPRNVILIIGDGMGPQQIGLLELYARRAPSRPYGDRPTAFAALSRTGVVGLSLHDPDRYLITDSACSATQLALGLRAPVEALGVDRTGEPRPTVLEVAKKHGMATGLVSDTRLTHATPAAFAAHLATRSDENAIASQMLDTAPDVMLSGGWRHFVPDTVEGGRRTDGRDLLAEARDAGYAVVRDVSALDATENSRLLGLFSPSGMMDAIAERRTRDADDRTEPSLQRMAQVALDHLDDDPDGFFLMIEAGQVDWAGHGNDAGWLLHEMVRAEETIAAVVTWAEARGDTLVVVTADHETGGFGLGYSHANLPAPVALSGSAFSGGPHTPRANYADPAVLDRLYAQQASWGEVLASHAALPEAEQGPIRLAQMIRDASGFTVDETGAARILASAPDRFAADGTDAQTGPAFRDFAAFYPTAEYGRGGLIARELAAQQNVVWATGGHTHTPVPVFAVGPGADAFAGLHHHTELGQILHSMVRR